MIDLDAIRMRWTGAEWYYTQEAAGGQVARAWVIQAGDPPIVMVDLAAPQIAAVGFLALAALAPKDIRALLDEVAALIVEMQERSRIDAEDERSLQNAYDTLFETHQHEMNRLHLENAALRARIGEG